jgi:hypothetical protein
MTVTTTRPQNNSMSIEMLRHPSDGDVRRDHQTSWKFYDDDGPKR